MDENYLDNLLNEVSLDKEISQEIEDELDSQMEEEKRSRQEENVLSKEDIFNMDLEQDANLSPLDNDLSFSEEQIEELDKLDNLADLDIGDLDFSDIDLNDLDMTKLDDLQTEDLDDLLKDFEGDLEIENPFGESEPLADTEEKMDLADQSENNFNPDQFLDSLLEEENTLDSIIDLNKVNETDQNLDNTYGEVDLPETDLSPEFEQNDDVSDQGDTLDDLFSLLDMNENGEESASINIGSEQEEQSAGVLTSNNADGHSISEAPSGKKTFTQILFGDPDEDDILSEEELAAIEAKKEKKRIAKEAKKQKAEEAKAEKAIKNEQKKKESGEKKRIKAEKKAKRKAEELANAEPEAKLNTPVVIFIFSLFLGGTFLFYIVTSNFNYTQAIEKAASYFTSQKYHRAYDEVKGIEVKEKDKELKNRIYTVMYVERLYESYQYNIKLDRKEKALDALLRGVDKYYEHYDEAVQLGIESDLNYSFNQIKELLSSQYGITVDQALEINALENYEYVQTIQDYVNRQAETDQNKENDNTETTVMNMDQNREVAGEEITD